MTARPLLLVLLSLTLVACGDGSSSVAVVDICGHRYELPTRSALLTGTDDLGENDGDTVQYFEPVDTEADLPTPRIVEAGLPEELVVRSRVADDALGFRYGVFVESSDRASCFGDVIVVVDEYTLSLLGVESGWVLAVSERGANSTDS